MRSVALLLLLAVVAGCGDRRSFDERYQDTGREIENRAREIDRNIAANENASDRPED
jgi:hypothetical protein